ncbi:hypothetical protein MKX01_017828 [Papaver californicum]|nr:hypothetical protein MKX01_017828 [Papaver californicum]
MGVLSVDPFLHSMAVSTAYNSYSPMLNNPPVLPSLMVSKQKTSTWAIQNSIDHCSSNIMRRTSYNNVQNATPWSHPIPDRFRSTTSTAAALLVGDRAGERTTNNEIKDLQLKFGERDFAGSLKVPVYVMLPLGVINMKSELVDPDALLNHLKILKSINVDGVMVDYYNWSGYKRLFKLVRRLKLKLQVVMSFHECGGNVGDNVTIPLPGWVKEIGKNNPDIYFTDKEGRRTYECLSWGIDKERVLKGRTAVEVYFDYMRSFRVEFDEFFEQGVITEIEIGLGPCGELRYPSYPIKHGWKYPGIGEFQCYDRYLMKSLTNAANERGHSFWGNGPQNAGCYTSKPHETGFFCNGGDFDSHYGRFFLNWYSQVLIDHADRVLSLANLAFEGNSIAAKLSGVHWWYKTASHAAELTAGFYNPSNRDGYAAIAAILKKHNVSLNFTCVELRTLHQEEGHPEAMADPEGLVWQVHVGVPVASENALPCYDKDSYNKILETAKPSSDPDGRHLVAFTYLRLTPQLMENKRFAEFTHFVQKMHGDTIQQSQGTVKKKMVMSGIH